MTIQEIAALLVREPFNFTEARVAKFNSYQLLNVFFRPRDDEGALVRPDSATQADAQEEMREESFKELFFAIWRSRGESEEEIEERWERQQEKYR